MDINETLSQLLWFGLETLDLQTDVALAIDRAYVDLAAWIKQDSRTRFQADAAIYSQGSRRLQTVVRPLDDQADVDIDLVYCRDLRRTSISQMLLKEQVGDQLRNYADEAAARGKPTPTLEAGRRSWRLQYERFHLDVLPALPDDQAESASGAEQDAIIITDRALSHWQQSNPKGYASWFERYSVRSGSARAAAFKADSQVDVEPLRPHSDDKTVLQRCVQLLKRHRDLRYQGDDDDKPISVIITTLATLAYQGEQDLYAAVHGAARRMREHIRGELGAWVVANPVNPDENFADKWAQHPRRAKVFFDWLDQVAADIGGLAVRQDGLDETAGALKRGWGNAFGEHAASRFGSEMQRLSSRGALRSNGTRVGLGASAAGVAVPRHTFFGTRSGPHRG